MTTGPAPGPAKPGPGPAAPAAPEPSRSGVPRYPGVRGYTELATGLKGLRLRHFADLLADSSVPTGAKKDARGFACFRLLDGFRLAQPGGGWRLVDRTLIRDLRPHVLRRFGPQAEPLVAILDAAAGEDEGSALLRHCLLYQVIAAAHMAAGVPGAVAEAHLTALGVHPAEASALARVAAGVPSLGDLEAVAAEELPDAVGARRLGKARVLVSRLPRDHDDWRLAELCEAVERDAEEAARLFAAAERCEADGEWDASVGHLVSAVALAADDKRGLAGLVRLAVGQADRASADGMPAALGVAPAGDGVRILRQRTVAGARSGAGAEEAAGLRYTVHRIEGGQGEGKPVFAGVGLTEPVVDTAVGFGRTVRYVAVPMRGGLIVGPAAASPPLRYAPEIDVPFVTEGPEGIRMAWRRPPRALAVEVVRSDAGGTRTVVRVTGRLDGFDDLRVVPGRYEYTVRCGYPDPAGSAEPVWSAGVTFPASAEEWPTPVGDLKVESSPGGASLVVTWTPTLTGTDRVVPWPFGPVDPGSDISGLVRHAPAALVPLPPGTGPRKAEVAIQPGSTLHLMAVSELEDRAVAGSSQLVQKLDAPTDLRVERTSRGDTALVRFAWPEPAVVVAIEWETARSGVRLDHVARSGFAPEGHAIAVDPDECRVTVWPCGRPDAALAVSTSADVMLPALPAPPVLPDPVLVPPVLVRARRKWWAPWTWFRRRLVPAP